MSDHSFNPFIAKKYGIIEAILINTLIFWTRTNAAKESNYHENRYWCFGTPAYFQKFFIYLTSRQIKYALDNLFKSGALVKGNFNKKGYDKTNWYSLSDNILNELNLDTTCLQPAPALIEQICPMDRTNLSNGSNKFVQPIPVTKPVTKTDITTTTEQTPVVVVNISSKTLSNHETVLLSKSFVDNPIETKNIKSLNDFLSAALFSLLNRTEGISRQQRLHGIVKLVKQGLFEEPPLWAKKNPNPINLMKTPTEDDFRRHEENKPGYEWVGIYINSMYQLDRLPTQEYYQMGSANAKGYKWVKTWIELKGLNQKQK